MPAEIEAVIAQVDEKLEGLISFYRNLLMNNENDPLHERLFAFCTELEGLRKIIIDVQQTISHRIECVGKVAEFIEDMVEDIKEYAKNNNEKTFSNIFIKVTDQIEEMVGMNKNEFSIVEDNFLNDNRNADENYFTLKKNELLQMVAEHPEIR